LAGSTRLAPGAQSPERDHVEGGLAEIDTDAVNLIIRLLRPARPATSSGDTLLATGSVVITRISVRATDAR